MRVSTCRRRPASAALAAASGGLSGSHADRHGFEIERKGLLIERRGLHDGCSIKIVGGSMSACEKIINGR